MLDFLKVSQQLKNKNKQTSKFLKKNDILCNFFLIIWVITAAFNYLLCIKTET